MNLRVKLMIIISGFVCGAFEIYAVQAETMDTTKSVSLHELVVTTKNINHNSGGYNIRLINEPITIGKNATEIFEYLPDVSVESGTIKINGIEVSNIYIDGRKIDNHAELNNIAAEMISSVDVKYTSDGSEIVNTAGGTINIKLKKLSNSGYYGTAQCGGAFAERNGLQNASLSATICARFGKFSLYDSPFTMWMNNKEWSSQVFSNIPSNNVVNLLDDVKYKGFTNALSLNYEFNNSSNLGISWNLSYNKIKTDNINENTNKIDLYSEVSCQQNYLSLNYKNDLTDKDNLSFNGEWMNRHYVKNQCRDFNDDADSYGRLSQNADIYQAKLDYQHKFSNNFMLNFGSTYKAIDLRIKENRINSGNYTFQKILAQTPLVYASLQGTLHHVNYYVALNWQLNKVKVSDMNSYHQKSWNPTAQLSYSFGSEYQNQLMLIYKHILDNIPYDALVDKKVWTDSYNYSIGNPQLKSPTEHYLSLVLGLFNNTLNLSASYMYDVNTIYWQSFTENDSEINYVKPINLLVELN